MTWLKIDDGGPVRIEPKEPSELRLPGVLVRLGLALSTLVVVAVAAARTGHAEPSGAALLGGYLLAAWLLCPKRETRLVETSRRASSYGNVREQLTPNIVALDRLVFAMCAPGYFVVQAFVDAFRLGLRGLSAPARSKRSGP